MLLKFYRKPALTPAKIEQTLLNARKKPDIDASKIQTEWCFYVETEEMLGDGDFDNLCRLLKETYEPEKFDSHSFLIGCRTILEIGPRLNFQTAWSSRALSIFQSCGLGKIKRIEHSLRLGLPMNFAMEQKAQFLELFCDRMTEIRYPEPLKSFETDLKPAPVRIIDVIVQGKDALRAINKELGLSMDEQDIELVYNLFVNILKRPPTDVEIAEIAGLRSEHTRHLVFNGNLVIDGQPMKGSLMDIIKSAWRKNPGNAVLAFSGSAIWGHKIKDFKPIRPGFASPFSLSAEMHHVVITAETHNYPSGVDPYPGYATGAGGRERDNEVGAGRGGKMGFGGSGYCTGNLHIPGYDLPWEQDGWTHPENLASPLKILIRTSDGGSDYQNCIGEPLPLGFVRTLGLNFSGEYWSYFKPIMYTFGVGQVSEKHLKKGIPEKGMLVVEFGGPGYRIGLGGATASSMIQGENKVELDFNAVQRGDAEMQQRANRLINACAEMGEKNPIALIQDYGAGGNFNADTELVDPAGAIIYLRAIPIGDNSLSALEIWFNESQERYGILVWPDKLPLIRKICEREKVPCAVIGEITGDGKIVLCDDRNDTTPVNLPLDKILGKVAPKTFEFQRIKRELEPLVLPKNLTVFEALNRVLRLPSVGSKGFLVRKADRSVTGLVVQQQCAGPNHLSVSDCAIMAQSLFDNAGVVSSIGEQPLIGLISPQAMTRMAIGEAILNMSGAYIGNIRKIKFLANWMLAAKLSGEGARLYDAAGALDDTSQKSDIAAIGGKDSLSLATKAKNPNGQEEIVKGPMELVIGASAPMKNVTLKVTPDFKNPGNRIIFVDLANGENRLGGSALAQAYGQVGDECPDMEDPKLFKRAFVIEQSLLRQGRILSAHDRSDGLIVAALEMAFAGNVGMDLSFESDNDMFKVLFSGELGLVMECSEPKLKEVMGAFKKRRVPARVIGKVSEHGGRIRVRYNGDLVLDEPMTKLRQIWEATSTALEMLQTNPNCVREEASVMADLIKPPPYKLTFKPKKTPAKILKARHKPKVAVIREQGSNGDREMAAALKMSGFEPWDVTMTDLISGAVSLDDFIGTVFVGGFTFGDVLDAAKGWAGVINFNPTLAEMFTRFYKRPNTFSLGVCNGSQLMPLIGWVPWQGIPDEKRPRFIENTSGRFESRFPAVRINRSPAIMLKGMGGSILGGWSAHGQGRFHAPDKEIMDKMSELGLIAMQFVDTDGNPTEIYPFNPNGSPNGVTAICSPDGRHLATMIHPERTFLLRQYPWLPEEWKNLEVSPWLKMFQNAYEWCVKTGGKKEKRKEKI